MRSLVVGGIVAAVLLVVGSALDWTGVDYSSTLDRWIAGAAGVASALVVGAGLAWRRRALVLELIPGAFGLNMGIVNIVDVERHAHEYAAYPDASVGVGLYLVLVGGGLAFLVGVVAAVAARLRLL